ncbi:hypothetical protein J6590_033329 [Homalodisca vitripennis]|nr:hypothetical protein J6590_033329 [Homalodisca vitripennis]
MTLILKFGPSGRQEQEVSCWNLAGTSQIVIQFCNEEYDRGKRYSLKSRADGGFRNPRPRLDIVQLTEAITVGRTNSRICRLEDKLEVVLSLLRGNLIVTGDFNAKADEWEMQVIFTIPDFTFAVGNLYKKITDGIGELYCIRSPVYGQGIRSCDLDNSNDLKVEGED